MRVCTASLLALMLLNLSLAAVYDTKLSLELATMSQVSFATLSEIDSWSCEYCNRYALKDVKSFINGLDIQGFVGYNPARHAIIAAFRGSVDLNNWLANVDTVQVNYPRCSNCGIHQGFYNGYKAVQSNVNSQVSFLMNKYPGAAVYITGHSLGGALASVAATQLLATFGRVDLVYTTGQPRVGNQNYANHITNNFQYFRLVHYADLVPHCPASGIIMGFKHGGTEVWYTEDMQRYQICASEDSKCANSIGMMSRTTKDHSLPNYYIKLLALTSGLRVTSI